MCDALTLSLSLAPFIRLVCLTTAASRAVIVLHLAVSQSGKSISKDADVKTWIGNLREIRRDSRRWRSHGHVQHLLGLQLTILEAGLMSLPDPQAKGRVAAAGFTLAVGVAKSVVTMKADDAVFKGITEFATEAIKGGARHLANSCFQELVVVETSRAVAQMALRDGRDEDIRTMIDGLYKRTIETQCGRWEVVAFFSRTLKSLAAASSP